MIAYVIQCNVQLDHVPRLIRWIYHPDNRYLITVNPRSPDTFDVGGALEGFPNVHVMRSIPVTWGGESFMAATLNGVAEALERWPGWRYAINLSETDIPLKRQPQLFDYLAESERRGITEHLAAWGPALSRDLSHIPHTSRFEEVLVTRPDTRIVSDAALNAYFADIERSPILDAHVRAAIHALESRPGEVYCRPLHPQELRARAAAFRRSPLYIGRIWFCLSREACRWLTFSDEANLLFEVIKSVYNPDECFVQTALLGSDCPVPWAAIRRDNNLRFLNGSPENITDDVLPQLIGSDRFFARKLINALSPRTMAWADRTAEGAQAGG